MRGGDMPDKVEKSLGGLEQIPAFQEVMGNSPLDLGMFDFTQLVALMPMFDPEFGQQIWELCGINVQAMLSNLMGMFSFLPMVVQKMADTTRQLNVRLTWKYGPREKRTLEISTFISGLPEEQVQMELQKQDAMETIDGMLTP